MEEIKGLLKNHRYFLDRFNEQTRERFIFGEITNKRNRYILYIPNDFFSGQIDYFTTEEPFYIQEYPIWFKEIFKEVYELYYEKNRIRIIATYGKKPYLDIVLLHSLFIEDGSTFFDEMNTENGLVILNKKWESELENLKPILEKEGYQLTFSYKTEDNNVYQIK